MFVCLGKPSSANERWAAPRRGRWKRRGGLSFGSGRGRSRGVVRCGTDAGALTASTTALMLGSCTVRHPPTGVVAPPPPSANVVHVDNQRFVPRPNGTAGGAESPRDPNRRARAHGCGDLARGPRSVRRRVVSAAARADFSCWVTFREKRRALWPSHRVTSQPITGRHSHTRNFVTKSWSVLYLYCTCNNFHWRGVETGQPSNQSSKDWSGDSRSTLTTSHMICSPFELTHLLTDQLLDFENETVS